jgi:hypothetical protein
MARVQSLIELLVKENSEPHLTRDGVFAGNPPIKCKSTTAL